MAGHIQNVLRMYPLGILGSHNRIYLKCTQHLITGHIGVTCCLCSQCVHNVPSGYLGPCPQCLPWSETSRITILPTVDLPLSFTSQSESFSLPIPTRYLDFDDSQRTPSRAVHDSHDHSLCVFAHDAPWTIPHVTRELPVRPQESDHATYLTCRQLRTRLQPCVS